MNQNIDALIKQSTMLLDVMADVKKLLDDVKEDENIDDEFLTILTELVNRTTIVAMKYLKNLDAFLKENNYIKNCI